MLYNEVRSDLFNSNIENAIRSLKNKDFSKAEEYIVAAMTENYNSAEPHNLLGIFYELKGDLKLARKHYRASLCLNQALKSANKNLERICKFKYVCSEEYIDYGENINKIKVNE